MFSGCLFNTWWCSAFMIEKIEKNKYGSFLQFYFYCGSFAAWPLSNYEMGFNPRPRWIKWALFMFPRLQHTEWNDVKKVFIRFKVLFIQSMIWLWSVTVDSMFSLLLIGIENSMIIISISVHPQLVI